MSERSPGCRSGDNRGTFERPAASGTVARHEGSGVRPRQHCSCAGRACSTSGCEMVRVADDCAARHVLRYAMAEAAYVVRSLRSHTASQPAVAERALGLVAGMRQSELLDLADDFAATRRDDSTCGPRSTSSSSTSRVPATRRTWPTAIRPQELADGHRGRTWGCTERHRDDCRDRETACYTGEQRRAGRARCGEGGPGARYCSRSMESTRTPRGPSPTPSTDLPLLGCSWGIPWRCTPTATWRPSRGSDGWRVDIPAGESDEHQLARLGALYPFPF